MKIIKVELGSSSYKIRVGPGLLAQTGRWLQESGFSGKLVIITDHTVKRLHGDTLEHGLASEGFSINTLIVPEGEEQKSLETAGTLTVNVEPFPILLSTLMDPPGSSANSSVIFASFALS